jgi:hypothetical protein
VIGPGKNHHCLVCIRERLKTALRRRGEHRDPVAAFEFALNAADQRISKNAAARIGWDAERGALGENLPLENLGMKRRVVEHRLGAELPCGVHRRQAGRMQAVEYAAGRKPRGSHLAGDPAIGHPGRKKREGRPTPHDGNPLELRLKKIGEAKSTQLPDQFEVRPIIGLEDLEVGAEPQRAAQNASSSEPGRKALEKSRVAQAHRDRKLKRPYVGQWICRHGHSGMLFFRPAFTLVYMMTFVRSAAWERKLETEGE